MTASISHSPHRFLPPLGLLAAAFVWGVVWYPYRLLEAAGISGSLATLATYSLGLLPVLFVYGRAALRHAMTWRRLDWGLLLAVALVSGWTNLAYVLAVLQGEVMRVLLLFYLAPLWTILFARLILGEHSNLFGYLIVALSLAGAMVMLYPGDGRLPLPANAAEWFGISAGIGFALSNVLSRRVREVPIGTRAIWVFAGVVMVAVVAVLSGAGADLQALSGLSLPDWGMLLLIGLVLVLATVSVQYGLAHTPANRAIVILLLELVVAAIFSWLLAGELMDTREWIGGAMIVAASLFSGKLEQHHG